MAKQGKAAATCHCVLRQLYITVQSAVTREGAKATERQARRNSQVKFRHWYPLSTTVNVSHFTSLKVNREWY